MRLRATESQAGLTFRQRRLNVRGAFTVSDPAFVANKHVLLIDDIFTTGATARAAAQALVRAGAASVWVATLARACSTIKARGGFRVGGHAGQGLLHNQGPRRLCLLV
jgi:predicted amidophosphoribosyltransferase